MLKAILISVVSSQYFKLAPMLVSNLKCSHISEGCLQLLADFPKTVLQADDEFCLGEAPTGLQCKYAYCYMYVDSIQLRILELA